MRQEIAERDRPLRRIRLVQRAIRIAQDSKVCELWSKARDWLVQCEAAFVVQHQGGHTRHRLRHRRDSKNRVPLDGQVRHQIPTAHDRRLHDASVPPHQRRGAGEGSGIYISAKSGFDRIRLRHSE